MSQTNTQQVKFCFKTFTKRYYPLAVFHFLLLSYFFPIRLFLERHTLFTDKISSFRLPTFYADVLNLHLQPLTLMSIFLLTLIYGYLTTIAFNNHQESTRLLSMPLNRKMHFLGNTLAACFLLILPVLLTTALLILMGFGLAPQIDNAFQYAMDLRGDHSLGQIAIISSYWGEILQWFIVHAGFAFICYGVCLVANVLLNQTLLQLFLSMILMALPTGFMILLEFIPQYFLKGYMPARLFNALIFSSPLSYFLNINFRRLAFTFHVPVWFYGVFALYLFGSFTLAYWLIGKRQYEHSKTLFPFPKLQIPSLIMGTIGASLLIGMLTTLISSNRNIGLIGYFLGWLIGFTAIQMVIQNRLGIEFSKRIINQLLLTGLICTALLAPVAFDWFNYSKLPFDNPTSIKSIEVRTTRTQSAAHPLDEEEAIDKAFQLYLEVDQAVPKTFWTKPQAAESIFFDIVDESGKLYQRRFSYHNLFENPKVEAALNTYYALDSYIDGAIPLLATDPKQISALTISGEKQVTTFNDPTMIQTLLSAMRRDFKNNTHLHGKAFSPILLVQDVTSQNISGIYAYDEESLRFIRSLPNASLSFENPKAIEAVYLLPVKKNPHYAQFKRDALHYKLNDFWHSSLFKENTKMTEDLEIVKDPQRIQDLLDRPRSYMPLSDQDIQMYTVYKDGRDRLEYFGR